ncbi:MAG: MraY family glycosyltransferase [Bacteroidota bacterium]|nr:MraY family glycosyltransferase [Bacteroidota bacterium]
MFLSKINSEVLIFLVFFTSFIITYITIPTINRTARYKNLFDIVDKRKVHVQNVPRLGGIAIFAGFIITILIFIDTQKFAFLGPFVGGLVILFFIGLKDDIVVISPLTKLIGQILAASVIIIPGNCMITNLHGFFGIHEIHWIVGFIISLLIFLVTTNAFNFIDGVDGLSASIGVLTSLMFGIWFFLTNKLQLFYISLAISAALFAFIRFNMFSKDNKIFMGDTGSMIIGYVLSFFVIQFNEIDLLMKSSEQFFIYPAPAVAFGVLIVPYFDMLRVVYIRLLRRKSIYCPDKNHLHHLLLKLGFSHKQVTFSLVGFSLVFSVFVFWASNFLTIRRLFLVELIVVLLFSFIPEYFVKRKLKK